MFSEVLEEGHPVGKPQRFMGVQPGSKGLRGNLCNITR
jgi:hypothetical protein